MQVSNVTSRLMSGDLAYVLGRFSLVRHLYRQWRSSRGPEAAVDLSGPTLFPDLDVAEVLDALRTDSVFLRISLPSAVVAEIEAFCRSEPLVCRHKPELGPFLHGEIRNGYHPSGQAVPIGAIKDPLLCPAVRAVCNDQRLRAVVAASLGYQPTRTLALLYWSFASRFTDAERRAMLQHVIDYHYDVSGLNFTYVSFYLLDTTVATGAHVMMKGSHRGKSLRMLLGSAVAAPEVVHRRFGRNNEITIEGAAGTGFIQDTSCYHRASPPTEGDRLLLQLRFS